MTWALLLALFSGCAEAIDPTTPTQGGPGNTGGTGTPPNNGGTGGSGGSGGSGGTLASCSDSVLNATESDVDCGGGQCPACEGGAFCRTNSDCQSALCQSGVCQSPAARCDTLTPCPQGQTCLQGQCQRSCADDTGCPQGQACLQGQCADLCQAVSCPGAQRCYRGTCYTGCQAQSECPSGTRCVQNTCVPRDCTGVRCRVDEICFEGACQPFCTQNQDCSQTGATCQQNACLVATCGDGLKNGAETDTDCGGLACGACAVGQLCQQNADCGRLSCVQGRCQGTGGGGTTDPCQNVACPQGQSCQAGTCVADPGPNCPNLAAPTVQAAERCDQGPLELQATPGPQADSARWYTQAQGGNAIHQGSRYSPDLPATQTFYVASLQSSSGCESAQRTPVTARILTAPSAVRVTQTSAQCGEPITLEASGGTGGTIFWQNQTPDGTSTATAASTRAVFNSGTYYFRARSNDGCWSEPAAITVTVPQVQSVTNTWTATWSASYHASGNRRTDNNGFLYQGYFDGDRGRQRSLIGFDDGAIRAALSASGVEDVTAVRVFVYFEHWYYSSGGKAYIGRHTNTSAPSTWANASSTADIQGASYGRRGEGKWMDAPLEWGRLFRDGSMTGFTLGPVPDDGWTYYGYAHGTTSAQPPKIEITYRTCR